MITVDTSFDRGPDSSVGIATDYGLAQFASRRGVRRLRVPGELKRVTT